VNQAGPACVLVLPLGQGQVEGHHHLRAIQMARVSSVPKLIYDLKAPQCQPSRQAVGRRRRVLCNHGHEVPLGRKALNDLLATRHKREPEGYLRLGRMAGHQLLLQVPLRALLL